MSNHSSTERNCAICGATTLVWKNDMISAHEFACYKGAPLEQVPPAHRERFAELVRMNASPERPTQERDMRGRFKARIQRMF